MKTRQCPSCKIILPYREDVEHLSSMNVGRYGVASPECLALGNELLFKEYEYGRPMLVRFDAYGAQHPPHEELQKQRGINARLVAASKQSVAIHLLALYCMIEKKMDLAKIPQVMDRVLQNIDLENEELIPLANLGSITIVDVLKANTREEHIKLTWEWSKSAWQAWEKYHSKIREWYEKYGK